MDAQGGEAQTPTRQQVAHQSVSESCCIQCVEHSWAQALPQGSGLVTTAANPGYGFPEPHLLVAHCPPEPCPHQHSDSVTTGLQITSAPALRS